MVRSFVTIARLLGLAVAVTSMFPGCSKDPQPSRQKRPAEAPVVVTVARPPVGQGARDRKVTPPAEARPKRRARDYKVVHVYVALCDNDNQGIVPVPRDLGNGQSPRTNLYWGAMYGVKTFFRRSEHWRAVACRDPMNDSAILDRVVFRSASGPPVYVVAYAYDGAKMQRTLKDFLQGAAGRGPAEVSVDDGERQVTLQAGGDADLVCFVGHNGLMEHSAEAPSGQTAGRPQREAVVLCCQSESYFTKLLARAGARALVTTKGNMAPEAYVLDAVLRSWASGAAPEAVRLEAARAYAKYQKCSLRAAQRLFGAL